MTGVRAKNNLDMCDPLKAGTGFIVNVPTFSEVKIPDFSGKYPRTCAGGHTIPFCFSRERLPQVPDILPVMVPVADPDTGKYD